MNRTAHLKSIVALLVALAVLASPLEAAISAKPLRLHIAFTAPAQTTVQTSFSADVG